MMTSKPTGYYFYNCSSISFDINASIQSTLTGLPGNSDINRDLKNGKKKNQTLIFDIFIYR